MMAPKKPVVPCAAAATAAAVSMVYLKISQVTGIAMIAAMVMINVRSGPDCSGGSPKPSRRPLSNWNRNQASSIPKAASRNPAHQPYTTATIGQRNWLAIEPRLMPM